MIRNLSLILESIVESAAKAIAAQKRSLASLAKVALDNRIALDYLLAGQGGACAVANATCCPGINTPGEAETHYIRSLSRRLGLKR